MLGGQARARVAHPALEPDALGGDLSLEAGLDGAPAGGLHRRSDQVVVHLPQAHAVDHHLELGVPIVGHQHRHLGRLRLPAGLDVVHRGAQGGGLGPGFQLAGLSHGQVDRLGQQPQHPLGGSDDGADIGLGVGRQGLALQQIGDRQHAAHRGADLATQHLHEFAANVGLVGPVGAGLQRL